MSNSSYDEASPDSSLSDHNSSGNNQSVGLANAQLSQDRRHMLDLVNRLHNTGVQVDIDLPLIAVIGSQSAGKSSLIESISGITLPRAAGTCTRCPTECRLARSSGRWQCIVSLHRTKNGQVSLERFGQPIFEDAKHDVEDRIRRAQRAILNPGKPAQYFLMAENDDHSESEVNFSLDRVSLQISGPDVADLSFCDLPGLIAGVGRDGDEKDISLVQGLVGSYIKNPSCIILLTVACETDFQNQGAQELAKVYDPEGKRTIGVLTKPDRIPIGEEPNWLCFIKNEKESLENNWYCVKQPGSNELKQGMNWTDARRSEEQFFSFTNPWCEIDEIYKKYLGTSNLVSRLSSILSDLISKRIPEIQDEIERSIMRTKMALGKLPKEPSRDPYNDIAALLFEFAADLSRHVEGFPDKDGIIQTILPARNMFRRTIRSTVPEFVPFEKWHSASNALKKPTFLANEEGEESDWVSGCEGEVISRAPNRAHEEGPVEEHNPTCEESEAPLSIPRAETPPLGSYEQSQITLNIIHIDEVLNRGNEARTRELPGNYPFVVQENFIKDIIKKWNKPADIFCQTVYAIMNEHVKKLVAQHFSAFGQGGLEHRVKILMQEHLKKCMNNAIRHIIWLLDIEERPFTLNDHYFQDYKNKFLAHYRNAREKQCHPRLIASVQAEAAPQLTEESPQGGSSLNRAMAALAEMGLNGLKPEDLAKLISPDGKEHALVVMADVRAYFQVAYKRFVDNVPLAVDRDLVRGVRHDVLKMLNTGLGITGPEGHLICRELAQENQNISGKREELSKKLERMNMASQELLKLRF
ncbi:P-loop containing nucleoside triphosphate hydrolase protein [Collybia nuda]|uniref:P-loop containing nucleoside triphosphate hydrolase protein n=1 Tax=Collybia nuda TaxID=64659 RepID=A0A9P5Y9H6_9AGAR|nr:P-loop containing nucleoside triphosphate hydrolase protein [Collybia nuda]